MRGQSPDDAPRSSPADVCPDSGDGPGPDRLWRRIGAGRRIAGDDQSARSRRARRRPRGRRRPRQPGGCATGRQRWGRRRPARWPPAALAAGVVRGDVPPGAGGRLRGPARVRRASQPGGSGLRTGRLEAGRRGRLHLPRRHPHRGPRLPGGGQEPRRADWRSPATPWNPSRWCWATTRASWTTRAAWWRCWTSAAAWSEALRLRRRFPWPVAADALGAGENWLPPRCCRWRPTATGASRWNGSSSDLPAGEVANWVPSAGGRRHPGPGQQPHRHARRPSSRRCRPAPVEAARPLIPSAATRSVVRPGLVPGRRRSKACAGVLRRRPGAHATRPGRPSP